MSQPAEAYRPRPSAPSTRPHDRVPACSIFRDGAHACGYSPSSTTHDFFWCYEAQVERLRTVFPRGRFKRDEDGTAILLPRSRRWAGCHLYEQAPGRLVGLAYVGASRRITQGGLARYLVQHFAGDGEGFVHLRWDPALARLLPTFSKGAQRGVPPPGKRFERGSTDNQPDSDAPPAVATPRTPTTVH
jgi:hypothetical protein